MFFIFFDRQASCECTKSVDVVKKQGEDVERLARHFKPQGKGFCPNSLKEIYGRG